MGIYAQRLKDVCSILKMSLCDQSKTELPCLTHRNQLLLLSFTISPLTDWKSMIWLIKHSLKP